jgi:hypothetical protein
MVECEWEPRTRAATIIQFIATAVSAREQESWEGATPGFVAERA